ncbi:Putative palmitoyl-protein thioesterase [Komagataella phaffii CBS 7435]|uniref:Palmitoyl-protein thioesterase 1 n=2 Tax=Komagataella phaffii TaxID=460519 RepID=C4R2U6_KOMPG|nr:Hypothetical protein PAS_chr2-2_0107 [Komagataella phaffii GS115]AOA63058.1 GQ67_01240T0 [Komagataella phaffii]CAH2447623.1 Putative palmitoyl-protein thioesterase [Komagataella phaffii CBS 7435]AOA67614.1 GQ68_00150T0 [Komagataella phaffii GS115]CAY69820.1 Hypothetical protein PAS_chr2-2_0107 [Komagataella phaffii GS115]CCA37809.1 Putative palmitoyl-protein thioesterase [Komagataella phaffii CBS 7435]
MWFDKPISLIQSFSILQWIIPFGHLNECKLRSDPKVVLWHGLGDFYNSPSISKVEEQITSLYPNAFIHSIRISEDSASDQRSSFVGNLNDQLKLVHEQLLEIPELDQGFVAIGFSQGGLFLRSLVETASDLNVTTLITFGSPHNGIYDLPTCEENDWLCKRKNQVLKSRIWSPSVQESVVPAQYFRDPSHWDDYIAHSGFIRDINNELKVNYTYIENMKKLERLVLVKFDQDDTLVPKESAWFLDFSKEGELIGFTDTASYSQNLIGLKDLYENSRIDFLEINDRHMAISDEFFRDILEKYL